MPPKKKPAKKKNPTSMVYTTHTIVIFALIAFALMVFIAHHSVIKDLEYLNKISDQKMLVEQIVKISALHQSKAFELDVLNEALGKATYAFEKNQEILRNSRLSTWPLVEYDEPALNRLYREAHPYVEDVNTMSVALLGMSNPFLQVMKQLATSGYRYRGVIEKIEEAALEVSDQRIRNSNILVALGLCLILVLKIIILYKLLLPSIHKEEELNKKLDTNSTDLQTSQRNFDEFITITTTGFNEPFKDITKSTEALDAHAYAQLDEKCQTELDTLKKRTSRINNIFNDLIEYSKASRKPSVKPLTVDTKSLIRGLTQTLDPQKKFIFEIQSGLPTIITYKEPLEAVFKHLIENAMTHHDKDKAVIVIDGKTLNKKTAQFTISDNGPGIADKDQQKIFEFFKSIGDNLTENSTGLGLNLVKKYVETYGGTLSVDSKVGKGTVFRFTWSIDK